MNDKNDTRFWLASFFENQAQATSKYKSLKGEIENHGCFIIKHETYNVKIYTPELALILVSKELPAQNMDTNKETTINGFDYLKTYIEGYKEGVDYFKAEFAISPNTLYGANAEQYVRDIHINYFHIRHTGINEGWYYVKNQYPNILTHKAVREYGYNSGIVSQVKAMVMKYPQLFQTFDKCEHTLPPQQKETNHEAKQETENNVLVSTIEDWLYEFKYRMTETDYNTLITALKQYFETGSFPEIGKPIKVGKINKKLFGWALNQIYRSQKTDNLPREYLLFAKQNISLFTDVQFDENNIIKSNLYKYFTTHTK